MVPEANNNDFINFLNRIYWISSHLAERLEELKGTISFSKLDSIIALTIILLDAHIEKLSNMLDALNPPGSITENAELIAFMETVYSTVLVNGESSPYVSLLDYITIADALMATSAKLAGLTQLTKLNLPGYELYNPSILQPLLTLLSDLPIIL